MKRMGTYLLAATLLTSYGFCRSSMIEINQNSNLFLHPQDVPIFYDNNPLTGLKSFTIITSYSLKDLDKQVRIGQAIEKTLGKIGQVCHLKDNDMRGFGTGNIILIQIGNITGWDGGMIPVSRISLSIETPITLDKTGIQTFPMVWSINTFLQESLDSSSEDNLTKATQKLVDEFTQSYQDANREQPKRPVFYTYD